MATNTGVTIILRRAGGAAGYAAFDRAGIARSEVLAAVRSGAAARVRNGWFAAPDAAADVVRAVRVGGIATASTVARLRGVWVPSRDRLHVRVSSNAARLRSPHDPSVVLDARRHGVCVHYRARIDGTFGRDPLTTALGEMFACALSHEAIAAVESAIERRELDPGHLDAVRRAMPPGRRGLLDRLDLATQSGLETKVRLLLHGRRVRFRTQAPIDGVGMVDFLVGDRLVIEVDGWEFHSSREHFENDRRRDFELVTGGYQVLRLSYRQVVDDWERSSAGILALLARGEHRWQGRRLGPFPPI
jgi:very-short-patch-repair endonuclease